MQKIPVPSHRRSDSVEAIGAQPCRTWSRFQGFEGLGQPPVTPGSEAAWKRRYPEPPSTPGRKNGYRHFDDGIIKFASVFLPDRCQARVSEYQERGTSRRPIVPMGWPGTLCPRCSGYKSTLVPISFGPLTTIITNLPPRRIPIQTWTFTHAITLLLLRLQHESKQRWPCAQRTRVQGRERFRCITNPAP
jgi:hypothetical protein